MEKACFDCENRHCTKQAYLQALTSIDADAALCDFVAWKTPPIDIGIPTSWKRLSDMGTNTRNV
jgi:hypothetical protein